MNKLPTKKELKSIPEVYFDHFVKRKYNHDCDGIDFFYIGEDAENGFLEYKTFCTKLNQTYVQEPKVYDVLPHELEKIKKDHYGKKSIFIICTVRRASDEYKKELEEYVLELENLGCAVHLPHRDTVQTATGYEICTQNKNAIESADEVHIFYNTESQGTHFDMGVAFALNKKIIFAKKEEITPEKSFKNMLHEWEKK